MKVSDYMKLKLNNKGYMLVEIILASAIAFGLAFFIIDLTIKLKNKNDDLMVETLMNTDRTIINNKLMSYAKEEEANFACSKLTIDKNTIKYKENVIDNVNEYGIIHWDKKECSTDNGKISIKIPIDIPQMPDKEYDIIFDYKYQIGDMIPPTCSLETDGTTIKATYSDNEGGSGITYYGWDSAYTGDNSDSKSITVGTHTYYVKDKAKNSGECNISIIKTNEEKYCPSEYSDTGSECQKKHCPSGYYDNGTQCVRNLGSANSYPSVYTGKDARSRCSSRCSLTCGCSDTGGGDTNSESCRCDSPKLYCSSGSLYNKNCYKYANYNISTTSYSYNYTCSDNYTKVNDSYCYK